jgi:mono/diheme cytochrome c family protein
MKKSLFVFLVIALLSALILAACGSGGAEDKEPKIPAEFTSKTNPLAGNADAAAAGQALYMSTCATCHGDSAKGDGPAGAALDPKPADLVAAAAEFSDGSLYYIISEGGTVTGMSASMVGYKTLFSDDELWQVVAYLKTLK